MIIGIIGLKIHILLLLRSVLYGVVTTVWFTIAGTIDLRNLFRDLKQKDRKDNVLDDGRVVGHVNTDDIAFLDTIEQEPKNNEISSSK